MPWNGRAVGRPDEAEIRRLIAAWDPQFYSDLLRSGMEPLPGVALPTPPGGSTGSSAIPSGPGDPSATDAAWNRLPAMMAAASAVDSVVVSGICSRALEMVALEYARHGNLTAARAAFTESVAAARFDLKGSRAPQAATGIGARFAEKKLASRRDANEPTVLQQQMLRSRNTLQGLLPDGSTPTLRPRPSAEQRLAALDCMMWFQCHWEALGVHLDEATQLTAMAVVATSLRSGGDDAAKRALAILAPASQATPSFANALTGDAAKILGYAAAFKALNERRGGLPDPAFVIGQMRAFDAFEHLMPPDVTNRSATTLVMRMQQAGSTAVNVELTRVLDDGLVRLQTRLYDGACTFGVDVDAAGRLADELGSLPASKRVVAGLVGSIIDASLQTSELAQATLANASPGTLDSVDMSLRLGQQQYQTALYLRNLAYELGRDLSPAAKAVLADAVAVHYTLATETFAVIGLPRADAAASAIAQEAAQYQSQDVALSQ
jgi:hypothetical protein